MGKRVMNSRKTLRTNRKRIRSVLRLFMTRLPIVGLLHTGDFVKSQL